MTIRVNGEPIPESAIQFELNRLVRFYTEHMSTEELPKQMDLLKRKGKPRQRVRLRARADEPDKPWSWDDDA